MTNSDSAGNGAQKGPGKGNGKPAADSDDAVANAGSETGVEASTRPEQGSGVPPEVAQRIARARSQLREAFGTVVMAMMMLPRYRHQSLADLQHLLLEPLLQDRVAIAHRTPAEAAASAGDSARQAGASPLQNDVVGIAIWASVSEEVDAKIREQIRARVFPIRLKPNEWNSGNINWLFDIIAPDRQTATNIVLNFKQVVKGGEVRLHPILRELLDKDVLERLKRPGDAGPHPADAEDGGQTSH